MYSAYRQQVMTILVETHAYLLPFQPLYYPWRPTNLPAVVEEAMHGSHL